MPACASSTVRGSNLEYMFTIIATYRARYQALTLSTYLQYLQLILCHNQAVYEHIARDECSCKEDAYADESSKDAQPAGQDTQEHFGVLDAMVGKHRLYVGAPPGMVGALKYFAVVDARAFRVVNYLLPSVVVTCHCCLRWW